MLGITKIGEYGIVKHQLRYFLIGIDVRPREQALFVMRRPFYEPPRALYLFLAKEGIHDLHYGTFWFRLLKEHVIALRKPLINPLRFVYNLLFFFSPWIQAKEMCHWYRFTLKAY